MEPALIVDAVDEVRKVFGNVGESLERHWIDGLDLQGLHEALGLGIVVGIAPPAHRADEPIIT